MQKTYITIPEDLKALMRAEIGNISAYLRNTFIADMVEKYGKREFNKKLNEVKKWHNNTK